MQLLNYENTNIRKYENFIREISNLIVQRIDFEKLNIEGKTFLSKAKERFCFDNDKGWKFLTSSLDIIGDSEFAVVHFLNEKIENGNHFNTGELYLRLYGVLSAIYIQQQSLLKLCDLFKIDNLSKIKEEFDCLDITFLRHSISAHPINYNNSKEKVSFKIDRNSITNQGNLSLRDEFNNVKIYNIYNSINEYRSKAELLLKNIGTKMIENSYKSSGLKMKALKEKLKTINQ